MKILFITPYFYPAFSLGGTPRAVYELAKALVKLGNELWVLTTDIASFAQRVKGLNPAQAVTEHEGIKIVYLPGLPPKIAAKTRIFTARGIEQFLAPRLKEFDLVHLHEFRTFLNTTFLKVWPGNPPYLISAHGGINPRLKKTFLKLLFDQLWGKKLLAKADALVGVSPLEIAEYRKIGIPETKCFLSKNGISLEAFNQLPPRGTFKQKNNLTDKEIILFLGRLNWIKGIDFLIESFAEFAGQNLLLVIAGADDGYQKTGEKLAQKLGVKKQVLFLPPALEADKLALLRDASLLVLPSRYEIFGMVALEALLCETPVIVTQNCGAADWLKDYLPTVKFGDRTGLSGAIKNILANQAKARQKAKDAKKFVRANFSWQKIAAVLLAFYQKLLNKR